MSFWKTFGFQAVSAIDTLMEGGEFTLLQLLDQDEILQETKSQNRTLIDFLVQEGSMHELLDLITEEPNADADEVAQFKFPYIAAEILCSDVWSISDAFFQHEALLPQLLAFMSKEPPLNSQTSAYCTRVAMGLLQKKPADMAAFFRENTYVEQFLTHLSNPNVMELLLKLISSEDVSEPRGIMEWLRAGNLIPALVEKFSPESEDAGAAENAAQALVDIIVVSSHMGEASLRIGDDEIKTNSPLVEQLESPEIAEKLFSYILGGRGPALLHGLSVIIELLKRHVAPVPADETKLDDPTFPLFLKHAVDALPKVSELLSASHESAAITLALGERKAPLGFHRLKLIEMCAVMARLKYCVVERALVSSGVFRVSLELFKQYRWNNFLHALIDAIVQAALASPGREFKLQLLQPVSDGGCGLLDAICDASEENEEAVAAGGVRRGYMGYITRMADAISAACEDSVVAKVVGDHARYAAFEAGPLATTRRRDNTSLAGYERQAPSRGFGSMGGVMSSGAAAVMAALSGTQYSNDDYEDDSDSSSDEDRDGEVVIESIADEYDVSSNGDATRAAAGMHDDSSSSSDDDDGLDDSYVSSNNSDTASNVQSASDEPESAAAAVHSNEDEKPSDTVDVPTNSPAEVEKVASATEGAKQNSDELSTDLPAEAAVGDRTTRDDSEAAEGDRTTPDEPTSSSPTESSISAADTTPPGPSDSASAEDANTTSTANIDDESGGMRSGEDRKDAVPASSVAPHETSAQP